MADETFDFGGSIDRAAFEQILEMDDDPSDREFSKPIVFAFFEQAKETFTQMDEALAKSDLSVLSALGHFLKGSSATLGFTKVKDHCQVIQQYGNRLTLDGVPENDESVCLARITEAVTAAKANMDIVEAKMDEFFGKS